jgi:hypothetical protein
VSGSTYVDVQVRRDDLRTTRVVEGPVPGATGLEPGRAVLRVERFALTANNVTYGACGAAPGLEYWRFFPAPEGWGRVPVWGFATVVGVLASGAAGRRSLLRLPADVHAPRGRADGLRAARIRRRRGPPRRSFAGLQHLPARAGAGGRGGFGARRVVLGSASSKTAYATAWLLAQRCGTAAAVEVLGLTSPGNVAFVEALGCYGRVLPYDAAGSLEAEVPTVYVDTSGDARVREAIHRRLGDALRHDCAVGLTHWEQGHVLAL